jgi:hypothetical protein
MTVQEHIARLSLQGMSPSSHEQLEEIEERSGLTLPSSFRKLWSMVGGCTVSAKIRSGTQAGQDVREFWDAATIIDKLSEDRLPRVLPFGEDSWGNWFFVDEKGFVRLVDWNKEQVELVSASFDEFLDSVELEA